MVTRVALLLIFAVVAGGSPDTQAADDGDEKTLAKLQCVPWVTSRVVGSPDPPLTYTVEPVFTGIGWNNPLYLKRQPGSNRLLVIEQGGEPDRPSRILAIDDDPSRLEDLDADHTHLFLQVEGRILYAIEFHPDFQKNGFVYVSSNGPQGQSERRNRVVRYTVSSDTNVCDPESELVILEWRSAGHDGADMVFGRDGMLYITTGDGTSDSDESLSAQDVTNLLGSVLRIDVDRSTAEQPYSVPKDNPFLTTENARGELWAFGLRNPWRMTVDPHSGTIWIGNNGQDLWETVHVARPGANYGWSVYEGNHPFYLNRQRGPAEFVPPEIEHHHREARSLTGGVVYYGAKFSELNGTYIYGDYVTGKIWGRRYDGSRKPGAQITWNEELADTNLKIAGFTTTNRGDLLVVDHGGGLFRLIKNPSTVDPSDFPGRLSDTGLFASTERHEVAAGVIAYSVNAPGWNDGLIADRFVAVPGNKTIEFSQRRAFIVPDGTVLMQTLRHAGTSDPAVVSGRRVETRLLVKQDGDWAGYSYRWNDEQDDAALVPRDGVTTEFELSTDLAKSDGKLPKKIAWRFPGRTDCLTCHSRESGFALGFGASQVNRDHSFDGIAVNQLLAWKQMELIDGVPENVKSLDRLVNPYQHQHDLTDRARSYLHTNCGGCHVRAGGGNARIELEFHRSDEETNLIDGFPQHASFGIAEARLIAPGDPARSVLLHRLNRVGGGQMPPLVRGQIDEQAVALIRQWIGQMDPPQQEIVKLWQLNDFEDGLVQQISVGRSFESGEKAFGHIGCTKCHRFQQSGGGAGPSLDQVGSRLTPVELLRSIISPSDRIPAEFATTVIHTHDGETVQGLVERETDAYVIVRTVNALEKPLQIETIAIEDRQVSQVSAMPAGLLNTLQREQVFDLLAYLIANGDADHAAFRRKQTEN